MAQVDPTCALVLWDSRLAVADREANTGAALTSSYTEADKRPGLPVSLGRLTAQVSGAQTATVDLEVSTNNPGLPGRQGVRVRASTDGGTTYLGHQRETEIRYYEQLPDAQGNGSGTEAFQAVAACVTPEGTPIVSSCSESDSVCAYFNGTDWVDSTGNDVNSDDHGENGVGLCVEPVTGTIIMVRLDADNTLRTYHSNDDGVSFDVVAVNESAVSGSAGYRIALAANRGGIVALVQTGGTAGDVTQLASSDLGTTWTTVDTASAEGLGWSLTVVDDVFFSFSFNPSTSAIQMTRTSSPYNSIPDASATAITTRTGLVGITAWSDVSGVLHCLIVDNGVAAGDGPNGALVPLISHDGGVTWTEEQTSWASDATNVGPRNLVGVHTPYGALVACNGKSPSDVDQDSTCHLLWLGGWSTREWNKSTTSGTFRQVSGSLNYGVLWLPFSQPGGVGMTVTTGGSVSLGGGWNLTGPYYATEADGPEQVRDVCFFDFLVSSGGSVTSLDVGFRVTIGSSYEMELRASTTQIRIRDAVAGSNIDTIALDMTERMQFMVTRANLYYKRPADLEWTSVSMSLTSGTPGGSRSSEFDFGVFSTSDTASFYAAGVSNVGFWDSVTGQVNRGHVAPCYLPATVGKPSVLSLYDGPGIPGDSATLDPRALYSIEHLDPQAHPSPDTRWRSTQTANAEHIVWDLGDESQLGKSVALVVAGGSFRQARISYYDGSTWQTAGTLDLGSDFGSLSFAMDGDTMEPDPAGTTAADRFISENELVGGYVIVAGSPNTTHRILANTGGMWADSATPAPSLRLEDASSIGATGMCTIVAPGGVMVTSPSSTVRARYWRVRFVAGQDCPDDRFEAGVAWMGRLAPFGAPPDWTWTDTTEPNVTRSTSSYGTIRQRRNGPPGRVWTWTWADGGVSLYPLRANDAAGMNGVGVSGGRAITAEEDVWGLLTAALRTHQELPVCALRKVPADGVTITDPTLWLYGILEGSVAARNVVGTEGSDEILRIDGFSVREQR